MPRLVLGSASPRRLDLLAQIGVRPDTVRPADIDETPQRGEIPRQYCARIARGKALAITADPDDIVLAADTTVAAGRRILGKPADRAEAEAFLRLLSGRRHRVVTAVAVRRGERMWTRIVESRVRMNPLGPAELSAYLDSGDWQGKAGGYGIQGPASTFIPWIEGSYTAIVGLPLAETAALLRTAGLPLYGDVR